MLMPTSTTSPREDSCHPSLCARQAVTGTGGALHSPEAVESYTSGPLTEQGSELEDILCKDMPSQTWWHTPVIPAFKWKQD